MEPALDAEPGGRVAAWRPWRKRLAPGPAATSPRAPARRQSQLPTPDRAATATTAAAVVAVVAASLLSPLLPAALRAEPAPRPADLRILQERTTFHEGTLVVGIFGREPEPDQPGIWRIQLWREWSDRVEVSRESVDCRPGQATRVGVMGGRVVVQTLNPGGAVTAANRLDHLIWWAACVPEQAGVDPAQLAALARRLGFDGQQLERIEVLPGRATPHP